MKLRALFLAAVVSIAASGCFYPPTTLPPPAHLTRAVVPLPYDLAWTAVNNVIRQNGYKIVASNPNHGIIEVQGGKFSLQDADCGQVEGIVGRYAAVPENDASVVYNFHVTALSNEKCAVAVRATFASPLAVPLRPMRNEECVSRGTQESRLLQQILAQATVTKPPEYKPVQHAAKPVQPPPALLPGRSTLLKPGILKPGKSN